MFISFSFWKSGIKFQQVWFLSWISSLLALSPYLSTIPTPLLLKSPKQVISADPSSFGLLNCGDFSDAISGHSLPRTCD